MKFRLRLFVVFISALILSNVSFARSSNTTTTKSKSSGNVTESAHAQKRVAHLRHHRGTKKHVVAKATGVSTKTSARTTTPRATSAHAATVKTVALKTTAGVRRRHHYVEQFTGHSFTSDNTDGDIVEGEDPVVRQAAIDALGNMNGTVVAIDPTSGRILAMVNQKLALSEGAQPCSTIKVAVALGRAQ